MFVENEWNVTAKIAERNNPNVLRVFLLLLFFFFFYVESILVAM
jgi:hypothetical protein